MARDWNENPHGIRQQAEAKAGRKPKCCIRDNDNDGNCDIHKSPGVLRPHIRRRVLGIEHIFALDLRDQPLNDQISAICAKMNEIIDRVNGV